MGPIMPGRKHSLADHAGGLNVDHVHGAGEDHDHDHGDEAAADPHRHDLTSIGIDIGSTTTQIVFARLRLDHLGTAAAEGRHVAGAVEILHRAPPRLTPFADARRIDVAALDDAIDAAFVAARLTPDDIDTGSVIMTGAALARENAGPIAAVLADRAGDIVAVAAGHRMEAMLAAYGSGAMAASLGREPVLNVDIGGATTKLALCVDGRVVASAVLDLGARVVTIDGGRVAHLGTAARDLAGVAGVALDRGGPVRACDLARLADAFVEMLAAALFAHELVPDDLWLARPPADWRRAASVNQISVSGGVGEYLRDPSTPWFGDLGQAIGAALAARAALPLAPAAECLRATALGACAFSIQRGGATSYLSDPARLLPRRDLPVYRAPIELGEAPDPAAIGGAIAAHLAAAGAGEGDFALALPWSGEPSHARLRALAEGIARALAVRIAADLPLYLFVQGDVARTLGAILVAELGVAAPLLVLDGIALWDLDFVDLGRLRLPSGAVPVTVKSLLFAADPRAA